MTPQENYSNALVAFRQASHGFADAARTLNRAAQDLDPRGLQNDDPAALAVFEQVAHELRALSAFIPGIRQLLAVGCGAVK